MLYNVGPKIIHSENLISTIAYKMGPNADPVYALEVKMFKSFRVCQRCH